MIFIFLFLLIATSCAGQSVSFTTNDQSYLADFGTTVSQTVHVELSGSMLSLTDARTGNYVGRYRVNRMTVTQDGVIVCQSNGNDKTGRFYRHEIQVCIYPNARMVEVWQDGRFKARYGMPIEDVKNAIQ